HATVNSPDASLCASDSVPQPEELPARARRVSGRVSAPILPPSHSEQAQQTEETSFSRLGGPFKQITVDISSQPDSGHGRFSLAHGTNVDRRNEARPVEAMNCDLAPTHAMGFESGTPIIEMEETVANFQQYLGATVPQDETIEDFVARQNATTRMMWHTFDNLFTTWATEQRAFAARAANDRVAIEESELQMRWIRDQLDNITSNLCAQAEQLNRLSMTMQSNMQRITALESAATRSQVLATALPPFSSIWPFQHVRSARTWQ
ncbi:hypothetical protein V5O48_013474, partial [Marasmius crinis-equi]